MYEDLARSVLLEDDPAVADAIVRIRSKHPRLSDAELAGRLTETSAWRSAVAGGAIGAGMALLDRNLAAVDLPYQALTLQRLASSLALARRRPTTVGQRALAAVGSLLVAAASDGLRRVAVRGARRVLRNRAPRVFPIVSAVAGAAIAYAGARVFARAVDDVIGGRGGSWR